MIFAVGALIGSFTYISQPINVASDAYPSIQGVAYPQKQYNVVGQITGMAGCKWAGVDRIVRKVTLGSTYKLASGLVEITYNTGTRVVLQGPVAYEVNSGNGGYLSMGKLTARMEQGNTEKKTQTETVGRHSPDSKSHPPTSHLESVPSRRLFTITTPTAVITDLGTEFGVQVDKHGNTTSHVYHGTVSIQPILADGSAVGPEQVLYESDSVFVEKSDDGAAIKSRHIDVAPNTFVRVGQFAKQTSQRSVEPFDRWQAFSSNLRLDSSLVAYYDFQQRTGQPSVLPNVASNNRAEYDGVVENATWTTGRMPGKHALLFQHQDDCVKINLPDPMDALTLSAWVNVMMLRRDSTDDAPSLQGILLSDEWGKPGQVHWQIDSDGRIIFAEYGIDREHNKREWDSPPILDAGHLRKWTHLTVTMDLHGRVCFYVDGRLMNDYEPVDQEFIPIQIGPARIGAWNRALRTLRGKIDELAIFNRVLSSDEIQDMFESGNVNQVNNDAY